MSYGRVDPHLDLIALEERVLEAWHRHDIPAEVERSHADDEPWIFYEGPPTANGRPGLHHVWARVFKDLYPRFQTMRGRSVPRKGGWDCHGLPVEIEVEKALGLADKGAIEAYGIEEFNRRCRESVSRYIEDWTSLTRRSGVWIDTDNAYWTLSNDYVESVWWLLKQMWDRSLLYEGHRVTPYCGRCGTALSSHEVAQGYKDITDTSVYVRFPITDAAVADLEGADLLVWTTTPWTLLSNTGAAVAPDVTYVRVSGASEGADLILAEARAHALFGDPAEAGYAIAARMAGSELVGARYQRPFDVVAANHPDAGWRVVAAGFVTVDDGSGIVHLAPAFGADDMEVGKAEGLPVLNPVDAEAAFDESVPDYAGRFVRDADPEIIADLARRGLLVREEPYTHSYPHCWRCDTPLIYWAKTSWFARTADRRDDLIRENERIGWHPEHIKHGRFGDWLENNVDWALSRDRYWGTPLPIWRCADRHDTCVGSVAELSKLAGRDLSELDLHRPYVDDVSFPCPHEGCDHPALRLGPVLDAWFDSGSMPSAQHHYPFADDATFDRSFPADFICEAIDQTRGWFYSLLAVNTLVFDQTPYRNVVCLGHIVDESGAKMSKSRGNVIDPWDVFAGHGADALRWYFFSAGQPWSPRRVFEDGIRESTRKTLLTYWNVWSFFATYADLAGWDHREVPPAEPTHVLDRWILSELDDTITAVTEALDGFDALAGATRIARFVDDLSNWHVRRSRPRFWASNPDDTDHGAFSTLHTCLVTTSRLLAPFCPFLAEEVFTAATGDRSVHLADWPEPAGRYDASLSEGMDAVRRLVVLGRAARTDAKIKVRQPLSRALLLSGVDLDPELRAEIAAELNVKALEDVESLSGLMSWTVIPNFRTLGPRLGPKVNEVKAALATADGGELKASLDEHGFVEVAGERLTADDVEVRAAGHGDFALVEDSGWAVALDLELTDELREEGFARELVRALNDLRKSQGLELSDRIHARVGGDDRVRAAVDAHRDWIAGEILALDLTVTADGLDHHVELDGTPVQLGIAVAGGS